MLEDVQRCSLEEEEEEEEEEAKVQLAPGFAIQLSRLTLILLGK